MRSIVHVLTGLCRVFTSSIDELDLVISLKTCANSWGAK